MSSSLNYRKDVPRALRLDCGNHTIMAWTTMSIGKTRIKSGQAENALSQKLTENKSRDLAERERECNVFTNENHDSSHEPL